MYGLSTDETAKLMAENTSNLIVLDVRREAARLKDGAQLLNAIWLNPALWLDWKDDIKHSAMVIFYCAHGQEISQALTTALRVMGIDAYYMIDGIARWHKDGRITVPLSKK